MTGLGYPPHHFYRQRARLVLESGTAVAVQLRELPKQWPTQSGMCSPFPEKHLPRNGSNRS